ncbi:hypothetical protein BS47DRAFT_1368075 [Hydnum rufescens UP504]|uniref:Uncharacterized protein n=1 Tax=Hydnum rufescens UP504 TaxID=1448309 RepID=A0A9P6AGQ2_9AGAM|nr:hypothetical protein BS47DRAFT_1368075 [Hydnum rufescens UP504]
MPSKTAPNQTAPNKTTPSEMHHDTEVAMRWPSGHTGHMNHTPAMAGVWFYIRLARPVVPGPLNDNPPAKNPTPAIVGVWFYMRLSSQPPQTSHPSHRNNHAPTE